MKKMMSLLLAAAMTVVLLAACGNAPPQGSSSGAGGGEGGRVAFRLAGLKGATSMGMVGLLQDAAEGTALHNYEMNVYGTADELNGKLIAGEIDVAALPANVAAVLYNKTGGDILVAAVNTLGVLYIVETGDAIQSVEDLRGRTVYAAGKGTVPEYVLNFILRENGLDPDQDLTIEYKSEATEVAALLNSGADMVAMLPQPYATIVQAQNGEVRTALDLTAEWDRVSPESALVTGVLVVRRAFAEQNPEAFAEFLQEYAASIAFVNAQPAAAAVLVEQFGIFEKAAVVEKALPLCNIVYADGGEMKAMLSGYLEVLHAQKPEAVGGALPGDDFYYGA